MDLNSTLLTEGLLVGPGSQLLLIFQMFTYLFESLERLEHTFAGSMAFVVKDVCVSSFLRATHGQLRGGKSRFLVPKRHQIKHLEFSLRWFGTRRSVVERAI
jgi:hypothetical protein